MASTGSRNYGFLYIVRRILAAVVICVINRGSPFSSRKIIHFKEGKSGKGDEEIQTSD
jgi:hypothetical protein